MPERKPAKKGTKRSAKSTASATKSSKGFSAEERAAMRERARELKAEAAGADAEKAVLATIAAMQGSDRAIAQRLHAIVKRDAWLSGPDG